MTSDLNYVVTLRKDTPSQVGGLDTPGEIVPVNRYPMPPGPVPHDLTLTEFNALPASEKQLSRRSKVYTLQRRILAEVEGSDISPPVTHLFTSGMYLRRLTLPAGFVVVSKRHSRQHICALLQGSATVFTEDGVTELRAPFEFVSPAGAKRVILTHGESTWLTVHATTCTDVESAERDIFMNETEVLT